MKRLILIFVVFMVVSKSFSQEKSEIFIRTSLNSVQDFTFEPSRGIGFGMHLGIRPNFEWKQLQPYVLLGFETTSPTMSRNNALLFWYDRNLRLQAGLERQVLQSEKERLWIGAGASLARGMMVTGYDRTTVNGIIVSETIYRSVRSEASLQLSLRYQNQRISEVMSLGYTIDYFFEDTFLYCFSIHWKIH
jgi:hypothetical protein